MDRLSIFLLGGFGVTVDGAPVTTFESDKVRALLAYLAVESERAHRRESLAGMLWPERPERSARQNLSQALFNLRQAFGDRDAKVPFLITTRQIVQFNRSSDCWLDVSTFVERLTRCEQHSHERLGSCEPCMEQLQRAVDLYKGEFLAGFSLPDSPAYEEWVLLERERLNRLVTNALRQLADCHIERGEYEDALKQARRLVELDPLMETAHRQVMVCLSRGGQRSAALAQYETCCRILMEELGVEPEAGTSALYERIRSGDVAAIPARARVRPHNLPPQQTPFVGRLVELAELDALLCDSNVQLVTVVGPGGIGKTRLALEAAAAQLERFEHGVFFVALAPLSSAVGIVPAVADAVGFTSYEGGEPRSQLLDYLRGKQMLLVMDNYEHLLEQAPPAVLASPPRGGTVEDGSALVSGILNAAPDVKVLVTSRARLNLLEEQLFHLGGMDFPDWETPTDAAGYSGVVLFVQSARRVRRDFGVQDDDLTYLTRICRQVGGMPLGILLAAGWVDVLAVEEIAEQIGQSLDFLETELRNVPERQRSIRAAVDHSWKLLTKRQRNVMRALSVFRGGFASEAARAVAGASLRELRGLVDRSLLQHSSARRYDVHELLRQYAEEKLDATPGDGAAARDRHCAHYAAALQRWGEQFKGARQQMALAEASAENDNVRAAWQWAVENGQVAPIDQALDGLCLFHDERSRYQEGEAACRAAAEMATLPPSSDETAAGAAKRVRLRAKTLTWQGYFGWFLGRTEQGHQLLDQALTLLDGPELVGQDIRPEKAAIFYASGILASDVHREKAEGWFEKSLTLYRALDDRWRMARALEQVGFTAWYLGGYDRARRRCEEALAIRRALGDRSGSAESLRTLSQIAQSTGQCADAVRLAHEAQDLCEGMNEWVHVAKRGLSAAHFWSGEFGESLLLAEESGAWFAELGSRRAVVTISMQLSWLKLHLGQYQAARENAQTNLGIARDMGHRWAIANLHGLLGAVALAEGKYAEASRWHQESAALHQEIGQREGWGWVTAMLGYADRGQGDSHQAWRYMREVLSAAVERRFYASLITGLPAVALLLLDAGETERAVELYALASGYGYVANSKWFEDIAGREISEAAASLPPDVVAAAQERGKARDLWETAGELVKELENVEVEQEGS